MGEMNHCPKHGNGYGSCVACAIEWDIRSKRAYEDGLLEQIQSLTARLAESEARENAWIAYVYGRGPKPEVREGLQWSTYIEILEDRESRYRKALASIAANTCCDKCKEAALVAQSALAEPAPSEGKPSDQHIPEGCHVIEDADGERYVRTEPVWADGHQRLISFGRNRSGQDSGELDFSIAVARVAVLSPEGKRDLVRLLNNVRERVQEGLA